MHLFLLPGLGHLDLARMRPLGREEEVLTDGVVGQHLREEQGFKFGAELECVRRG